MSNNITDRGSEKISDKEELAALKKTFEEFIQTSSQLQQSYEFLKEESQRLSLYLSNILENMNSSVIVFDNAFRLTLWNGISRVYFPYLEGKDPPVEIEALNRNNPLFNIQDILQNDNTPIEIETEINEQKKWIEVDSSDFIDYKRNKIGYLMVIHDKTEFKKLQIKSQQEDRLRVMGELAAEVAHEIRNPLGSIELMVTMLQEDCKDNDHSSELLSRIRTSVDNMNHIVTNILLYTRELQLDRSQFEAETLIDAAESIALNTIVKKQINVDKNISPITLNADFELLKQSLANVLINAAQASPQKGIIQITTESRQEKISISIKDNGEGIPDEIKEKIFKPFFTTKNTGTGLGLAMVKRVIEAHAGQIFFNSRADGTLFIIEIPLK